MDELAYPQDGSICAFQDPLIWAKQGKWNGPGHPRTLPGQAVYVSYGLPEQCY